LYRAKANGRNRVEQFVAALALEGAAPSQSSKAAA
jgi:hypothetical protein